MAKEIFERNFEREIRHNENLDLSLFKKKSSAKTYQGWIIGQFKKAINDKNQDVAKILETCYYKYVEFDELRSTARLRIAGWKGKSGIKIINLPEKFELISHKKTDKGEIPKEIKRIISKKEVNLVIHALNLCRNASPDEEKIKTRDIAREYCILTDLKENGNNRELFDKDGFIWENFFGDRQLHPHLVDILNILDYYCVIHYYRIGKAQILKKIMDIQLILK